MKNTLQTTQDNNTQQPLQLTPAERYYYQHIKPFCQNLLNQLDNPDSLDKEIIKKVKKHQTKEIIKSWINKRINNSIKESADEPKTIEQIIEEYRANLNLLPPEEKYSTALAIRGVRAYHLNELNGEDLKVFCAPSILHYVDNNNTKTYYSLTKDSYQKKHPLALGQTLSSICSYLSNKDITSLLNTNQHIRNNVKIHKNQMSLDKCQNIVDEAIKNSNVFLDLFRKSHFDNAIKLLESNQVVAYNDINANTPNLLKMIANQAKYLEVTEHEALIETIPTIFQLVMQKGGMQDIQIYGKTNLLKKFSFKGLLKIMNSKPESLIKDYQTNPTGFNLNTPDKMGDTILLEALSDGNPNQERVELVQSLVEAGADLNKASTITDEKPLERLIKAMEISDQPETPEQVALLEYIIKKLASNPDSLKMSLNNTRSSILQLSYNCSSNTLKMFWDAGLDIPLTELLSIIGKVKHVTTKAQEDLAEWIINKLKSEPSTLKTTLKEALNLLTPPHYWRESIHHLGKPHSITSSLNKRISDNLLKILLDAGLNELTSNNSLMLKVIKGDHLCAFINDEHQYDWINRPKSAKFFIDKMPEIDSNSIGFANSLTKLFSELINCKLKLNTQEDWVDYFIERLQSKPEIVKLFIKENLYSISVSFNNLGEKTLNFLLDKGLDLTEVLTRAIERKDTENIKLIIESGADVNKADENGVTPLLALIKRLLRNSEPSKSWPHKPLKLQETKEIIKLLIKHGADANKASSDIVPIRPLEEAMKMNLQNTLFNDKDIKEIMELLITKDTEVTENVTAAAAESSRIEELKNECAKVAAPTTVPKKRDEKAKDKEHKLFDKAEKNVGDNSPIEPKEESKLEEAEEIPASELVIDTQTNIIGHANVMGLNNSDDLS